MADAIETLREKIRYLDVQEQWQEQHLVSLLEQVRASRATLDRLTAQREDHEALIAEVEQARLHRAHAQYIEREPVVIIAREPVADLDGCAA